MTLGGSDSAAGDGFTQTCHCTATKHRPAREHPNPAYSFQGFFSAGVSENVSLKREVLFVQGQRLKIRVSLLRLLRLDVIWMYFGVFESLTGTPRLGKCSRIWIFAAQNTRAADSEPVFPPLSAVFVSRGAHSA